MRILPPIHADEFHITSDLIQHLLKSQVPSLARRRLQTIVPGGTNHVMIRISDFFVGRFPRHPGAAAAVGVERKWLQRLEERLSVPIPRLFRSGYPDRSYPTPWSILSWLHGEPAKPYDSNALPEAASILAYSLGRFVSELRSISEPEHSLCLATVLPHRLVVRPIHSPSISSRRLQRYLRPRISP